jgi:hypothetical protein
MYWGYDIRGWHHHCRLNSCIHICFLDIYSFSTFNIHPFDISSIAIYAIYTHSFNIYSLNSSSLNDSAINSSAVSTSSNISLCVNGACRPSLFNCD